MIIPRKFEVHNNGITIIEASCYWAAKRIAKEEQLHGPITLFNKGIPVTTFKIVKRCLPQRYSKHQYLKDGQTYDFLAQMIEQQGFVVPDKIKFPSEMDILIPHITFTLRGRIIETPLAIQIMKLDSCPSPERYRQFEELLASVRLKVEWL